MVKSSYKYNEAQIILLNIIIFNVYIIIFNPLTTLSIT